ncbi:MAG TPA: DUF885 domain-containing protein [Candidatus Limnocylindrales bacterium]
MGDFRARVDAFLDELFRLQPVLATDVGMHAHDGLWPDLSIGGDQDLLAFVDRWEAELRGLDERTRDGADGDDAVDRDLLLLELDAIRFATVELRELDWDALAWVYLLGSGLFPLIAREFAPLDVRLASIASRLEGMPDLLAVARERLGSWPTRGASRFHAETAIRQLAGVRELIDDALKVAEAVAAVDASVAALSPRLRAAADAARVALDEFERHLADVVVPSAEGEGRLGPELFRAKLRHTLRGERPDPDEVRAAAERAYVEIRREMVRIAREIWPAWMGDEPLPTTVAAQAAGAASAAGTAQAADADEEIVRRVLDAVAREHPAAPDVLDYCRTELARIEDFCRARDVVGLADEPLSIEWTPVFLRSGGGAMLIPPGPLDRGEKAFFAVTPIPSDWSAEQSESYLREDNDRMLRLLAIHEGVPGHYLQLSWANRCPSIARAVFWSGVFAEGWAVYVEQVLLDLGYGADDPALMLTHWKFMLRSVTNALIDIGIHTTDMSEDEAVELMVRGGFQEEAEARAKWDRARLTSTQLSTYFVGWLEMRRLERDRRIEMARAAGIPDPVAHVGGEGVVDRSGDVPGFVYREHLERVLSFGSPPIPILRRLVLGEQPGGAP